MTRSMNTDALSMRDVTKETDSMVVQYDNSKMDQTGDKTASKKFMPILLIGKYILLLL